ncbi:ABC transporter ATP-binding protein [Manganibacter manganicus]|uniref:ABC transporter ATP-binding protein n=1 Tax=Manganibacter manganicus TaxID=1873176 RepID=A0A1V8RSF7_9HYPH|nr:ABC transporter ATP-binding protein [Pseudaminobacter manganicus]OQM76068.1 ABC transporter ATP-binding protein [Pseudaminobacter manganicus]
MSALLSGTGLVRRFGGLTAINDVTVEVREGHILGIIGPNGAGKTTLFNLLSGFIKPTRGTVRLAEHEVTGLRPHRLNRLGLARTFQLVKPFARMSVLENVMVGSYRLSRDSREAAQRAREVLALLGMEDLTDRPARELTMPGMKRLEVARALATGPRLLLLDEVMSGLTPTESKAMLPVIQRIRDSGVTILMIEHVMHAIMALSDRIVVLHHGSKLAEGSPDEIAANPAVVEAYLGTAPLGR